MTTIENKVVLNIPIATVYQFLSDCNNHEKLMPENVYNWSSTQDEASFTIKNITKLSLKVERREENEQIVYIPSSEMPFDLRLYWKVKKISEQQTEVIYRVEADLNMMMKMLASGPLQKLVDYEISVLPDQF